MKTTRIALLALSLGALAGAASASTSVTAGIHIGSSGRAAVDVGFFYDDLAPYGNWVDRPQHGWCWVPRHTRSHWRPYQSGHWTLTDYGWTWVSDEPYGWATYHYGRWYDDPDYGWEWVPGQEWGPAWVSWQEGDNYVGWAPLPPSAEFSGNYGVDYGGVDFSASLTPEDYVFVPERQFLSPRLDSYVVSEVQAPEIWRQTRNFTNYRFENNRFINQGVPVDRIQQVIGRNVPRYQVADLAPAQRHQGERVLGNRVALFRPEVQRSASVAPPPARPIARRAVMTAAAAAATITAAHAAHQAYIAHTARAAAAGHGPQGAVRQQDRLIARNATPAQNARQLARQAPSQRVDRRNQQVQARQQQAAGRQQQIAARQQRTERQQASQRNQQAQQNRQQQATARQQQRVGRQQANQRNQQAQQNRQQQATARQQQRVGRQQASQRNQQAQNNRQQQRAARQQANQRNQQAQQNRQQQAAARQQQNAQRQQANQNRQQQMAARQQAQQARQQQRAQRPQRQAPPPRQAQAQAQNRPRGGQGQPQGQPQGNPRRNRQQPPPPNGPGQ